MAIAIKQLLNYSWISQASYLDFLGLPPNANAPSLEDRLRTSSINNDKVFSLEQSKTFTSATEGFSFQAHQPNRGNLFSGGDGFSATVFKANASAQYTIAVRGTETSNPQDLIAQEQWGQVLHYNIFRPRSVTWRDH